MERLIDFLLMRKWALVKTFKIERTVGLHDKYVYHIHCYESDSGKRRAKFMCNGYPYEHKAEGKWLPGTDFYQIQLKRWLSGRPDPEIPRYSELPEEDTANYLKGKV